MSTRQNGYYCDRSVAFFLRELNLGIVQEYVNDALDISEDQIVDAFCFVV